MNQIRIPTLLGIGVLVIGLVLGVFLVVQNQANIFVKATPTQAPKNITVSNISANSATVSWQTDEADNGFIKAGISELALSLTFKDDRDLQAPQPHLLHFVSLKNLLPDTTYYFQVISGSTTFPKGQPLTFKTSPALQIASYQPLIGQVIENNSQATIEALVFLEVAGAQSLSAITKGEGKFILPVADLKNQALTESFKLENTPAKLKVISPTSSATVSLTLPLINPFLPPIVLGQNLQLEPQLATASATPSAQKAINYDLNRDGKVNSLDHTELVDNLGNSPKNSEADLNGDGIVDRKDLDLMSQYIAENSR